MSSCISTDVDVSQDLGGMTYTFIFMNKDNKGSMTFYIYNGYHNSTKYNNHLQRFLDQPLELLANRDFLLSTVMKR